MGRVKAVYIAHIAESRDDTVPIVGSLALDQQSHAVLRKLREKYIGVATAAA